MRMSPLSTIVCLALLASVTNAAMRVPVNLNNAVLMNRVESAREGVNNLFAQLPSNDAGSLTPCDGSKPFTLTWSPKDVKSGETLVINFDFTPSENLSSGTAILTIWIPDYKDPIYAATQKFKCGDITKYFPGVCPFKAGKAVKLTDYKFYIKPQYPLPSGEFKVKVELKDEKGGLFLCAVGNINIVEDYDY